MSEVSPRETGDIFEQVRRDVRMRPSGIQSMHAVQDRESGSCGDTATSRFRVEDHLVDGDRPMVDGRDISELWIQGIVRQAIREYIKRIVSDNDDSSNDVGAPDETAQEGTLGDGVRQERYLDKEGNTFVVEERDGQRYYYIKRDLGFDIFGRDTDKAEGVSVYDRDG